MTEVIGTNNSGDGVRGTSEAGGAGARGVAHGAGHDGVVGESRASGNGMLGVAVRGDGVRGDSRDGGAGVRGVAHGGNHIGVVGQSTESGQGVGGFAAHGDGVRGESTDGGAGVRGVARGAGHDGVVGESTASGNGVLGVAVNGSGVYAVSQDHGHGAVAIASYGTDRKVTGGVDGLVASGTGVLGMSTSASVIGLVNPGGWHPESGLSRSAYSIGVCGAFSSGFPAPAGREAPLPWDIDFVNGLIAARYSHFGVYGMANVGVLAATPFHGGYGLVACNTAGGYSAAFSGDVKLEGNIHVTGQVLPAGSDCAECFELDRACTAEPGCVMVMNNDGQLEVGHAEYDRKVAGVVSGAGDFQPGIVLGQHPHTPERQVRIALIGRVMCKVDADLAPIELGDLLTTSTTPGHAMKATDPERAFGAVIGKALRPLDAGRALVPVLVALR